FHFNLLHINPLTHFFCTQITKSDLLLFTYMKPLPDLIFPTIRVATISTFQPSPKHKTGRFWRPARFVILSHFSVSSEIGSPFNQLGCHDRFTHHMPVVIYFHVYFSHFPAQFDNAGVNLNLP